MKFLTWIVSVIYFALTDCAPTTEEPSINLDLTNKINYGITELLGSSEPLLEKKFTKEDIESQKKFYNHSSNGILYNVTVHFELFPPSKEEIPSHENDTFKIVGQLPAVFLEGCLRDSNQHIVTEKLTLDYVIEVTPQNEANLDYPNFNHDKIHLHLSDYQYKPNEETQIKKEIETQIKARFHDLLEEIKTKDDSLSKDMTLMLLQQFSLVRNKQERYYFISNIPSTNYTLSNVTIYGLWNTRSISTNITNLAAFPGIELSGVWGSMVQNFPSTSEQLSFKADSIYISFDRNIKKVNVKITPYLVVNAKQNTPLTDDQSTFIIEEIESAFAASLLSAGKQKSERLKIFRI